MKKILIIEDDKSIAEIQKDYLEMSGFEVTLAYNGKDGLNLLKEKAFDMAVLDLMLPETDGMEILRIVGDTKEIPILVLSARDEEMYKVKALNLGADDYMTKPFGMGEFVARVKNHLKLYEKLKNSSSKQKSIQIRSIEIFCDDRRVYKNGQEIIFTQKEYEILLYMAQNPNRVFSKEQLFEKIWGLDALSDASTVTVHISKIRDKIESDPQNPQYIETVWGIGYRFKV